MEKSLENEEKEPINRGRSRLRRFGFVAGGIGLGSLVVYWLSKALGGRARDAVEGRAHHIVDDRGTGQEEAARMLRHLRDHAFDASDEKLAVALGRPVEEVAAWNAGSEVIDDDVVMKARGIAMNRGVYLE